ncbi:hypothetical protein CLAFUW4_08646 [Fulvia fulva]|uniref:Uncharacterized protein n=1 Tax=Passalora fulva TaxID=5499 RepID=A0A9Q8LE56_PASFU|nr:uncharacterized protein CLAFUR5_08745 [Fulvia fulva]KAK4629047.1 hypothetical protein CLAFUR4_08648 [Fulvia fulva]KAK4630232.1 hypothetical protein CLAFUR0_08644 [Fulvia fulva]UJO15564.1 hypothetical protein CLAFUR5_08745 [Fulvia fulva]WPV12042.1 hypothetical protein CLAFUW4_08646 [Fulvia fulva]WPV26986.1 hypothetical protein CLAFUW7_08643 [Fulvia fulva]
MADSKAQEAAREEQDEQWVEVAPPAYEASANGADEEGDLYYATPQHTGLNEKTASLPQEPSRPETDSTNLATVSKDDVKARQQEEAAVWYKQAPLLSEAPPLPVKEPIHVPSEHSMALEHLKHMPALPVRPKFDDEMLALQLQQEKQERAAVLPPPPHTYKITDSIDSFSYTFSWRRPLTDHPTLSITANDTSTNASHWRLNYQSKYSSRLHRYQADQARVDGDFPARQIAEIKFPEFILPGCGPTITFEAHEDAIDRKGSAHAMREDKFMKCSGWFTTQYALEVPSFGGARCTWRPAQSATDPSQPSPASTSQPQRITTGDLMAQAKRYMNDDTWTPYPNQQLIISQTNHIVATYTRAAPWAKDAGILHIVRPHDIQYLDEYIEGIIIATVAMVGMQDRLGLASSLMQASTEGVLASRRVQQKTTQSTPRSASGVVLAEEPNVQSHYTTSQPATTEYVDVAEGAVGEYKESKIQRSLRRLSDRLAAKSEALLLPQMRMREGTSVVADEKV